MAELSTTYPPDIYTTQSDGAWAWNTDGKIDDGVYASGDSSVKFKDTTPAGTTYAQLQVATDFLVPVAPGDLFVMEGTCRADDNDADQHLFMGVHYYNAAKVWQSNVELWGAEVTAVDTWETKRATVFAVPDGIAYMGHYFGKRYDSVDPSFNGWWDSVYIVPMEVRCLVQIDAAQTVNAAAMTEVDFDREVYDYGGNYDTAQHRFTAPVDGLYLVEAAVMYTSTATNTHATWLHLGKNGDQDWMTLDKRYFPAGGTWVPVLGSAQVQLAAGDYLEINVIQFDAVAHTTSHDGSTASGLESHFAVTLLGK